MRGKKYMPGVGILEVKSSLNRVTFDEKQLKVIQLKLHDFDFDQNCDLIKNLIFGKRKFSNQKIKM